MRPSLPLHALLLALAGCSTPVNSTDVATNDATSGNDVVADAQPDAAMEDVAPARDVAFEEDAAPAGNPLGWDARRAGPFATGYRTVRFGYTPPGASAPRELTFHIWYPTRTTTGVHPRYASIFLDNDTVVGAPLSPSAYGPRYPVHVHSHGDRGFGATSHFLMRYFASHGWVSIAPDHLLNTIRDTPDPRPISLYYLRGLDARAALDALENLPSSDPLAGRTDTARALLSGHSFGTQTVWAALGGTFDIDSIMARCTTDTTCTPADIAAFRMNYRDPRFVAAIPMAGSINREFFGANGHSTATAPILAMSGSADPVGADAQYSSPAPMPMTWIDVRGGCHQFFALGGCDMITDEQQPAIVGAFALAWGRRHVLNDTDATVSGILDGSITVSELVTLQRR